MTPSELTAHDAAKLHRHEQRARERLEKRTRAQRVLDDWVGSLRVPGDLPLAPREMAIEANEATMRGMLVAKFQRPNGAHALVLLREWRGELRLLFTIIYVENGGAVRSRGWTLYLRDVTADGEIIQSMRELDELIAALTSIRDRIASADPALLADVDRMHEAREAWRRAKGLEPDEDEALP
jgi:hypothetical protein